MHCMSKVLLGCHNLELSSTGCANDLVRVLAELLERLGTRCGSVRELHLVIPQQKRNWIPSHQNCVWLV